VTGVQTCALPISGWLARSSNKSAIVLGHIDSLQSDDMEVRELMHNSTNSHPHHLVNQHADIWEFQMMAMKDALPDLRHWFVGVIMANYALEVGHEYDWWWLNTNITGGVWWLVYIFNVRNALVVRPMQCQLLGCQLKYVVHVVNRWTGLSFYLRTNWVFY